MNELMKRYQMTQNYREDYAFMAAQARGEELDGWKWKHSRAEPVAITDNPLITTTARGEKSRNLPLKRQIVIPSRSNSDMYELLRSYALATKAKTCKSKSLSRAGRKPKAPFHVQCESISVTGSNDTVVPKSECVSCGNRDMKLFELTEESLVCSI